MNAKAKSVMFAGKAILFIDEIRRFSSLSRIAIGAVEQCHASGATTENPSFEVIPALRSDVRSTFLNINP